MSNPFDNIGNECYSAPTLIVPNIIDSDLHSFFPHHSKQSQDVIKRIELSIQKKNKKLDKFEVMLLAHKFFNKHFYDCEYAK